MFSPLFLKSPSVSNVSIIEGANVTGLLPEIKRCGSGDVGDAWRHALADRCHPWAIDAVRWTSEPEGFVRVELEDGAGN